MKSTIDTRLLQEERQKVSFNEIKFHIISKILFYEEFKGK